jgi:Right handed beta helix region
MPEYSRGSPNISNWTGMLPLQISCTQENCKSSFVIRHGHTNTIQDNEFIGEDGIRVYGKDNKILRNHFSDNKSKQFPPLTLVNGNTKDEPNEGASGSGKGHAAYTLVRNCEITGNTFENCNKCEVWGRDSRTFKPQSVKFRNNKVIADKIRSLVIEFSDGAKP